MKFLAILCVAFVASGQAFDFSMVEDRVQGFVHAMENRVLEKVRDYVNTMSPTVREAMDQVMTPERVNHFRQMVEGRAVEVARQAMRVVRPKLEEGARAVMHTADQLKHQFGFSYMSLPEGVQEKASEMYEQFQKAVQNMEHQILEKVNHELENIRPKVATMFEGALEQAMELGLQGLQGVEAAGEFAQNKMEEYRPIVQETIDKTRETALELGLQGLNHVEAAREFARDLKELAMERINHLKPQAQQLMDTVMDIEQQLENRATELHSLGMEKIQKVAQAVQEHIPEQMSQVKTMLGLNYAVNMGDVEDMVVSRARQMLSFLRTLERQLMNTARDQYEALSPQVISFLDNLRQQAMKLESQLEQAARQKVSELSQVAQEKFDEYRPQMEQAVHQAEEMGQEAVGRVKKMMGLNYRIHPQHRGMMCNFCVKMGTEMRQRSDEGLPQILEMIDQKVCRVMGPMESMCVTMAEQYIPQMKHNFDQNYSVEEVCSRVHLC